MAHFDEQHTQSENGEREGVDDSDFGKIHSILQSRDRDGLVSKQIEQCLQNDDLTLDLLCEFDDTSLNGVIDSWKIDYSVLPNQKPFIIRGLLINGIKKSRNNNNNNNNNNINENQSSNSNSNANININNTNNTILANKNELNHYGGMISEMEIKALQILEDYQKLIAKNVNTIENELKNNEETNDKLLNKHKTDITNVFDDLITKLIDTKAKSLENLETIFNKNDNHKNDYLILLNTILNEINETRMKYQINVRKSKIKNVNQLQQRSEENCTMINQGLKTWKQKCDGYKRDRLINTDKINVFIDKEVRKKMISLMNSLVMIGDVNNDNDDKNVAKNEQREFIGFGATFSNKTGINMNNARLHYKNRHLIGVDETIIENRALKSGIHKFGHLRICGNSQVTVKDPWQSSELNKNVNIRNDGTYYVRIGGILKLYCKSLILDKNATISVNAAGYSGGKKLNKLGGYQGRSIDNLAGLSHFKQHVSVQSQGDGPIIAHFDARLCNSPSIMSVDAISGGGGAGGQKDCGAGGGYATRGKNGSDNISQGGGIYGSNQMNYLYLGSGGGGDTDDDGTSGGGIIYIECQERIVIEDGASITANGGDNMSRWSRIGCGSGGSIYLKAPIIINNGKIEARGGRNINRSSNAGNGGDGRIRIDCSKKCRQDLMQSEVIPCIGFLSTKLG